MLKLTIALTTLIAVGCANAEPQAPLEMSPEEMQAKMMEYGAPGEAHAELAKMAGTWKTEMTGWWEPGGEPMQATGESTIKTILGGRYTVEDYRNTIMDMPFEGLLILGYDNFHAEYFSIWLDNWSTMAFESRGAADEQGNMQFAGEISDFLSPAGRKVKSVVTHESDDRFLFEMWDTGPDGELWKVMETVYTRK